MNRRTWREGLTQKLSYWTLVICVGAEALRGFMDESSGGRVLGNGWTERPSEREACRQI